jgi:hypothetical protein
MAETFFSIITRQAIRGGSFASVNDLIAAIEAFTDGLERPLPAVYLDQEARPGAATQSDDLYAVPSRRRRNW